MRKLSCFIALDDIHSFENILWKTCRGRVLYWGAVGMNSLGDHVSPTLALLAPVYALWQHPSTLIVALARTSAASRVARPYGLHSGTNRRSCV